MLSTGAGDVGERPHRGRIGAADWPVRVVSWSSGDVGTAARRRRRSLFSASDARASAFTSRARAEASGRMGRDDDPGVSVSTVTCLHAQGTTHVKYKVQDKQ